MIDAARVRRLQAIAGIVLLVALLVALAIAEVLGGQGRVGPGGAPRWIEHVRAMDRALAVGDAASAAAALRRASSAALASGRWEAMVAAGDAARRAGPTLGPEARSLARARRAYVIAADLAAAARSLDGVLQAGEALAASGDRAAVALVLARAERLARREADGQASARVQALAARLAEPELARGGHRAVP